MTPRAFFRQRHGLLRSLARAESQLSRSQLSRSLNSAGPKSAESEECKAARQAEANAESRINFLLAQKMKDVDAAREKLNKTKLNKNKLRRLAKLNKNKLQQGGKHTLHLDCTWTALGLHLDRTWTAFSATARTTSIPRAFFQPRNGIASKLMTPRTFFRQRHGLLRPIAHFSTPERDGFKIDDPSHVFSITARTTSTPRPFLQPRNGIASKLMTPRAFFQQRRGLLRSPTRFFNSGTG